MSNVIVLSGHDVTKVLTMDLAIEGVEECYRQKAQGEGSLFPMVFHEFNPGVADMDIKSGELKSAKVFGLKLVSWFSENEAKGLPALFGTILLFDNATGQPKALVNANAITGMRTGAASAVGIKYLAPKDASTLLMVGMGEQAPYQVAAALKVMPSITRVLFYSPRSQATSQRVSALAHEISEILGESLSTIAFEGVTDIETQTADAQIIITATPSYEPVIKNSWVAPGTHISCVGADMKGKQELDPEILTHASIFVDDIDQSISVGETQKAMDAGVISPSNISCEIGEVITGKTAGRPDAKSITVFDSTGIALQDLMVSQEIVDKAHALHLGTVCEL